MTKNLFGLVAPVSLALTAPAFAANGSAAAAMVKDARDAARRIEAQAEKPTCASVKTAVTVDCKPGTKVKEKKVT